MILYNLYPLTLLLRGYPDVHSVMFVAGVIWRGRRTAVPLEPGTCQASDTGHGESEHGAGRARSPTQSQGQLPPFGIEWADESPAQRRSHVALLQLTEQDPVQVM